jgi:hypothetical protein
MRRGVFVLVVLATFVLPASALAGRAITSECRTMLCAGLSQDGSRVVFPFAEELTSGAGQHQIYEWSGGKTRALIPHLSGAPGLAPASLADISADASHVFVTTNAALAAADTDGGGTDIYDLSGGVASLISTGPLDGQTSGASPVSFAGTSPDGLRVFFDAFGAEVPGDTDSCPDLYERSAGQTALVAPNPKPAPSQPFLCDGVDFGGTFGDGTHLFFSTAESLVPSDEEGTDIYQQVGGVLTRLTTYPERQSNCVDLPKFGAASADGGTVLFATNIPISAEDTDSAYDVYKREPDGSFVLVSKGTDGGAGSCGFDGDRAVALSANGHAAIFETRSRLSPEDRDSSNDLYSAADGGVISLLTTGPTDPSLDEHSIVFPDWLADVSDDASRVAFESLQPLVAADKDAAVDVYLRAGGQTELVSTGPLSKGADDNAELRGISADGTTVLFATKERLAKGDDDHEKDLYARRAGQAGGRPVLISAEAIPPQMRIGSPGLLLPSGTVGVKITCPKTETSGPCHGKVNVARGRRGATIGKAAFRIAPGRRKLLQINLRQSRAHPPKVVLVRVRGFDQLGNSELAIRRVTLAVRRSGGGRGAERSAQGLAGTTGSPSP